MTRNGRGEPGEPGASPPTDESVHETVGAYILGLLEPEEATEFEEHLAGCERCAEQLDELAGMGPMLAALAEAPEFMGEPPVAGPAAQTTPEGRGAVARHGNPAPSVDDRQGAGGRGAAHVRGGTQGRAPGPRSHGSASAGAATAPAADGPDDGPRGRSGTARGPLKAASASGARRPGGPSPRLADRLLADVAQHRARRRRRGRLLAGVAAVLIVAGPVTAVAVTGSGTGTVTAEQPPPPAPDSVVLKHMPTHWQATDPKTKVQATIGLDEKPWGTTTVLKLTHVWGPLKCSMVAVGTDGQRQTMATWLVPRWGYGIPDSKYPSAKDPLYVRGSSAFEAADIDHFEVLTLDGKSLVKVDARR